MLGALFFAALQFRLIGLVLARTATPGPRASDGMGRRDALLNLDHRLDSRADYLEPIEVQIVHVRRGVDATQGAVNLKGVGSGLAGEPLGVDYLDDVTRIDVFDAFFDGVSVALRREV